MTANHSPGCPAIADVRDGCACLLRQTSSTGPASSYPPPRVLPTSVVPAGEDYGAPIRQYGARGPLSDPPRLGEYVVVTYADHLAALAVAEKKGYHVGYKSAAGEFLTPESLAVTGMDDPRYAKGHADAVSECLVSDRERMEAQVAAYERGRADERKAAAQRVAAMDYTTPHEGWGGYIVDALGDEWVLKSAAIAAARGAET